MRLDTTPFVGNARARELHGYSAGADVLVLCRGIVTGPGEDLLETLGEFAPAVVRSVDADASDWLATVADQFRTGSTDRPVILVADGLRISPVALLDLLDRPGDPTAVATIGAWTVEGSQNGLTRLRTQRDLRMVHSVGTAVHVVSNPTVLAPGVARVAGSDRLSAAEILERAAASSSAANRSVDPFDLVLLALVRGGLDVAAIPLGPFTVERRGTVSRGAAGSPWQQRLAGASRGGDGFFSTMVIRPMSRRLTGVGLRHGWSPNAVTVTSLLLGLAASGLVLADNRWTWVVAAVLLQVALVVDCVDGEIARFTRRFSAFGAWLDAVGDRVKEYSLLAAVASLAVRRGEAAWLLATVAMVLVTARHLEDYAYFRRTRVITSTILPDRLPVDDPRDLAAEDADLEFQPPGRGRARTVFWAKKVMHLPIAERYLLLSAGLLTYRPLFVLWLLVVAVAIALLWTQGGRTGKALLGLDNFPRGATRWGSGWGHLDHQLDLGPLARAAGRLVAASFLVALAGVALYLEAAALAWRDDPGWAIVLACVSVVLLGVGCRPPLHDRLGWQGPSLLWVAESAVVIGVAGDLPEGSRWLVFAYLATVAWHRYDVVYRLRDTGVPPPRWITAVTFGVEGRILLILLLATVSLVNPVLGWAALALIMVYAVESARAWRAWALTQRAGVAG